MLAKGVPLQQLGDDVRRTLVHADIVDGNNIRMIQSGSRASLLIKTAQAIGVGGQRSLQDFDGNVATEAAVRGAIEFRHSTGAYFLQTSVVTPALPCLCRRPFAMPSYGA